MSKPNDSGPLARSLVEDVRDPEGEPSDEYNRGFFVGFCLALVSALAILGLLVMSGVIVIR